MHCKLDHIRMISSYLGTKTEAPASSQLAATASTAAAAQLYLLRPPSWASDRQGVKCQCLHRRAGRGKKAEGWDMGFQGGHGAGKERVQCEVGQTR